ncbi:putative major facilitator superfamily transporter [Diaporthe ampelina]|uniref:Putative major facilitator superfamily transporter n=1 Tax=Diaporthe ampelina TaxID=1214573 RepID=A0A0G2G0M6_9PEZI|nr:putative major facilitator superfamily transporter [Diaporthe ampelina]
MALKLSKLASELGLLTLASAPRDVSLIFLTRFLRMSAYGSASLVLALFFSSLEISETRIGLFMTLTLLGDVALSLGLTLVADAAGRRRILLFGCLGMVLAGAAFAISSNYWVLLVAAVVGVISVSGNEIGPFRAVEESVLAGLVGEDGRSDVFAWYVVAGTLGSAAGTAGAGQLVEGLKGRGWTELQAFRAVFCLYGAVGIVKGVATTLLSSRCEVDGSANANAYQPVGAKQSRPTTASDETEEDGDDGPAQSSLDGRPPPQSKPKLGFAQLSNKTRWTLLRLCALFAIDSLASGMVPYSLINFYMDRKFHMPKSTLGDIMSVVWVMASIGNVFASAISKRIGLVKTMVFTHLPSAIFLALLPAPKVVWLSVILLVARGILASMDQAPRSAFLSKVVAAEERTAVMGIVNVVKTLSQSGGPTVTGILAGSDRFWIAFVVAGSMKASYDLGLLTFFLKVEKQAQAGVHEERNLHVTEHQTEDLDDAFELESEDGEFAQDDTPRKGKVV